MDMGLHVELLNMDQAQAPRVHGESVLFTYRPDRYRDNYIRSVGIAFAHEGYRTIHPLQRVFDKEEDQIGAEEDKQEEVRYRATGLFFLLYPIPEGEEVLEYRYVVDGVWMDDPQAVDSSKSPSGLLVSRFPIPQIEYRSKQSPETRTGRQVTFRFRAAPGSRVYIAGSFNDWDPFMYRMREDSKTPGLYTLRLKLPEGIHFYHYVYNGHEITDPLNSRVAVDRQGKRVSVVQLK